MLQVTIKFGDIEKTLYFPTRIIKLMEKTGGPAVIGEHYQGHINLQDIITASAQRGVISWLIYNGLRWSTKEALENEEDADDLIDKYFESIQLDDGTASGSLADDVRKALYAGYGIDPNKTQDPDWILKRILTMVSQMKNVPKGLEMLESSREAILKLLPESEKKEKPSGKKKKEEPLG
jgi:hypothetical protein